MSAFAASATFVESTAFAEFAESAAFAEFVESATFAEFAAFAEFVEAVKFAKSDECKHFRSYTKLDEFLSLVGPIMLHKFFKFIKSTESGESIIAEAFRVLYCHNPEMAKALASTMIDLIIPEWTTTEESLEGYVVNSFLIGLNPDKLVGAARSETERSYSRPEMLRAICYQFMKL